MESHLCAYGCRQEAKFQLKNGKWCCSKHSSSCPELRKVNSDRIKKAHAEGRCISSCFDGRRGWNKGLTKDTDERVRKTGETLSRKIADGIIKPYQLGKPLTEEIKAKLSNCREEYLKKNPHVKWYKVSNGKTEVDVQGGWERKVAEWLTTSGVKWIRRKLKFHRTRRYTPDFYLPDYDLFIEVKGWWKDRDKYKMFLVLQDNPEVQLRILDKRHIRKLETVQVDKLPLFLDEFKLEDIDMSKFKNVWAKDSVESS